MTVEKRFVRDPLVTDAAYWHEKSRKPNKKNVGMIEADINMVEYIGGFRRYKKRTPAQEKAASEFKKIWDTMQLRTDRAVDLENPIVDTSFTGRGLEINSKVDAQQKYFEICASLSLDDVAIIEAVIVADRPQEHIAKRLHVRKQKVAEKIYCAMDNLADHFNL